jgi:hypothetical protein
MGKKTKLPPQVEGHLKSLEEKERKSQADKLVALAKAEKIELFRDPDGAGHADFLINGHRETWPLRSSGFRKWLRKNYYLALKSAPNREAVDTAVETLDAQAQFECECVREVFLRVAYHDGKIYYDLCNKDWEAVEISASGWKVIKKTPVRFRRVASSRPQVMPVEGGNLYRLRKFLNLKRRSDWVLLVSAILKYFYAPGGHPIIELCGDAGAAKTSTARIIVDLVDPSAGRERNPPREEGDVIAAAMNGYLVPYDNLSHLAQWLSDALCRLSTGSGLSRRTLFTNAEETTLYAKRAVVLTGINPVALRGDIDQRKVRIWLAEIEKVQSEAKFEAAFQAARPALFGAILSALAVGLKNLAATTLTDLPRMADYAVWGTACEPAYARKGDLMKVLACTKVDAVDDVLEHSVAAQVLRTHLRRMKTTRWETTASALYAQLRLTAVQLEVIKSNQWPADGQRLMRELNIIVPQLRAVGIKIMRGKRTGDHRPVIIEHPGTHTKVCNLASSASLASFDDDFNDLEVTLTGDAPKRAASSPPPPDLGVVTQRHPGVMASVISNPLKSNENDADDANDANLPTLSGEIARDAKAGKVMLDPGIPADLLRCMYCNKPGAEPWDLNGRTINLHHGCHEVWVEEQERTTL